jgi:hypothetical protein
MGCYAYASSPDLDGDLLSDDEEETLKTYADLEDSDHDGLRDGLEILRRTDLLDGWDPSPTVVHVPSDSPVIQKPLCLAVDGDEIIVETGTYTENLVFCGTNVILRSCDPENREVVASTIIDGGGGGSVISLTGTETEECVITGLTIRNGEAWWGGGILGGTESHQTRATIENNTVTDNSADDGGGLYYCNGTIQNNTVCGNRASRSGGGFCSCKGTTLNCIIWGNTAPEGSQLSELSEPGNSWVGGADPGFVDADGPDNNPTTWEDNDYHLASGSPCIDKGKNEDWMWDAVDLDGNPRIINGRVDMGAYEYKR